jgi:hypothetical protein
LYCITARAQRKNSHGAEISGRVSGITSWPRIARAVL